MWRQQAISKGYVLWHWAMEYKSNFELERPDEFCSPACVFFFPLRIWKVIGICQPIGLWAQIGGSHAIPAPSSRGKASTSLSAAYPHTIHHYCLVCTIKYLHIPPPFPRLTVMTLETGKGVSRAQLSRSSSSSG